MSNSPPRVGVVGGGVLGVSLALRLAQAGAKVTVIERGPGLGGLAGTMDFGGHRVDRFYHVITPADSKTGSRLVPWDWNSRNAARIFSDTSCGRK